MSAEERPVARLVLIGLVAGIFSSLFGVGGGIVIVPLLLLFARYQPRTATATSLGAIAITAIAGAVVYATRGDVHPGYAALVGLPASAGALAGASLQQRISGRSLVLLFAALITVIAAWFLIS